jgi:disease resistance protein RPM1
VGFDAPKHEFMCMINTRGNDGHVRLFCVVGMGDLGKTTLLRKIYESKEDIMKNVSCLAWLQYHNHFL